MSMFERTLSVVGILATILGTYFGYVQWKGSVAQGINSHMDTLIVKKQILEPKGRVFSEKNESLKGEFSKLNKNQLDNCKSILGRYYQSLVDETFDANIFFAPSVQKYITLKDVTPEGINDNVRKYFYKEWKQRSISFDVIDVTKEKNNYLLKIVEVDYWYRESYHSFQSLKVEAEIVFDDNNKIISFKYGKIISDIRSNNI